ncbi:MAG: NUDIX hydrolase [Pleurocapsa sp. SU_196_0]|nr:NUDIX hydrolase [Pleurocapsa sp. SU_196_0]
MPRYASKEELEFLKTYDPDEFPHPSLSVDVTLLTARGDTLEVFLIRRDEHPFKNDWSLPGGFVRLDESLEDAATRLLEGKTGLRDVFLEQLYTFGRVNRDPRTRVITVAYYALVPLEKLTRLEISQHRALIPVQETPNLELAFDHAEIIARTLERLRGKLDYAPIGYELLPERFTLRELQTLHETILGKTLNKDAFRRKMIARGELEATGQLETGQGFRPAEFYTFRRS